LLYAALLLADENHELKQGGGTSTGAPPEIANGLEALATRLETMAAHLENSG